VLTASVVLCVGASAVGLVGFGKRDV